MLKNALRIVGASLVATPILAGALVVILPVRPATADCPEECQTCSADPSFIQRDQRRPEVVKMLQEAKKRGAIIVETDGMVVTAE